MHSTSLEIAIRYEQYYRYNPCRVARINRLAIEYRTSQKHILEHLEAGQWLISARIEECFYHFLEQAA